MKTIPSGLNDSQLRPVGRPLVRATFSDFYGDVRRLRFRRWYAGSEPAGPAAACVAADGSLVRARVVPGTGRLHVSRVSSPSATSTWSTWTDLTACDGTGGVALAADASVVVLYYIDADGERLRQRTSTDNGASWSGASTVWNNTPTSLAGGRLAAAISGSGDRVVFRTYQGDKVYTHRWNGTSWTIQLWSHTVDAVTGVACSYQGDWCVVVTGGDGGEAKVWTALFGDGLDQTANTWSSLNEVAAAADGSDIAYAAPALVRLAAWRLFFVEEYSGTVGYERVQWSTMPNAKSYLTPSWREPVAFDYEAAEGVGAATGTLVAYLVSPSGVWGATTTETEYVATEDVLEATAELSETDGRVRLVLRNESGQYNPGTAAAALVGRGRRLQLDFGYRHPDAAHQFPTQRSGYWVESLEYVTASGASGGKSVLVVHARDAWHLLERWRARRQFAWAAGDQNVFQLLSFLLGRAGLDVTVESASAAIGDLEPSFTVHPGETGKAAVLRLLEKVPDVLTMRSGVARIRHPQAADASQYSYGGAHVVLGARYGDEGARVNRTRAFGAAVFDERFDWEEIEAVGERIMQVHDLNLTTGTLAGDRARDELRKATLRDEWGELVARMQGAQEIYDQVDVTDAPVPGTKRRVVGLRFVYGPGKYELRLRLASL